jgi:8-oxo-dGTP pyrophosphatase MutT (NUDIX family)
MHLTLYLEKLRALAQTGLNYSSDLPYHDAIYHQILSVCSDLYADRAGVDCEPDWQSLTRDVGVITPKVGAVVGITRGDGEVLLLERPTGRWCLPCGYADIGETSDQTARREVREETGLDVRLSFFLGLATTLDDPSLPFMWEAVYLAQVVGGCLKLSHEHLSAEWVSELDERLWHSTHRAHLGRALTFLQTPTAFAAIAMTQDGRQD